MDKEEVLNHWRYFLSLEKDVVRLKDYIEIHVDNFNTYSFELSKILQLACSEIDSVCRTLCKTIDSDTDYFDQSVYSGNIRQYRDMILSKHNQMTEAIVSVPGLDNDIVPWKDWKTMNSPEWWQGYNEVKHYRHSHFQKANLKNVLYAMAALEIIILYLYRIVADEPHAHPTPAPDFFDSIYFSPYLVCKPSVELPGIDDQKS